MVTQTINLNMVPGSVCPVIHVSQYDNDEDALVFNLYQGSTPFTAGTTAIIEGTKPDGYGFTYAASYSDNTVTADLTQQMTAVSGEVRCELRISDSDNVVGTQNFILMVEPAALDDNTVVSDSDIPAIAAAADYAAEAAASAADAATTLASAVKYTDIYNGLDFSGTAQTKALDALQGAALDSTKLSKTDIYNDLDYAGAAQTKALDALQGKAINDVLKAKSDSYSNTVSANSTGTKALDFTNFDAHLLAIGHGSYTNSRGLYVLTSGGVLPIIEASNFTISMSSGTLSIANSTGSTIRYLVL